MSDSKPGVMDIRDTHLISRLHLPSLTDCTPRIEVRSKMTGTKEYAEGCNLDRPEGMTTDELKRFSEYGQKFESNEKLVWNDLYGHATVLKQFSKYGGTINGVIPHGVYSPYAGVSGMELETGLPIVYNWLAYFDKFYEAPPANLEVVPMAAPFIYAMQNLCYDINTEGEGTLFIPYHSTDIWDFDNDWYHLVRLVRKENYPQPLAVLLFFEDINKGRHRLFQKKGIPVYTCGDKFRPEFLYQFIHIARHFKNILINDVSSPAFYAAYMGKNIITHGEDGVRYEGAQSPWKDTSPTGRAFPDEVYSTFAEPGHEQRWLARTILREEALQTPEQMKAMFEEGARHDGTPRGEQVCCAVEGGQETGDIL